MPQKDDVPVSPVTATLDSGRLVVAFCAAWCNTCDDFRKTFDGLAAARRDTRFVWLDIEDDAEIVGDIDVENFPTIAAFDAERLLHFGVSLPQGPIVARLLDSLDASSPTVSAADAVTGLRKRLGVAGYSPSSAATNCAATNGCRSSSPSPTPIK